MRKVLNLLACLLLLSTTITSFAQDDVADYEEYAKTNIAVTKFRMLGVTQKQYVKCVETENFLEPEKKLKFLMIEKAIYADNGQGYDLVADDGILTSNQLSNYTGSEYISPGSYKETPYFNEIVADELFAFRTTLAEKFSIKCKVKWVKCSDLPEGPQKTVCFLAGWPFGGFTLIECEI